ncbi:hypothetical protein TNCV_2381511 [Trichonephila clavipes]|nr:hypothetical protein TNCV_2381511 [Trichonephila clavipes]
MFDGLFAFAVDRWRHDWGARRVQFCTARVTNVGRKIRSGYLPFLGGYRPYGLASIFTGLESSRACVGHSRRVSARQPPPTCLP